MTINLGCFFNQLAVKIEMDCVDNSSCFQWLDGVTKGIEHLVPGAQYCGKAARTVVPAVEHDPQVVDCINELATSLCGAFGVSITFRIKYQRAAAALGLVE